MATPTEPSDPEVRVGWTREGPFGFTDEGQGPALVLLHGLPGSTRDWRWLAAALGGAVRTIRLDQPGFGATPRATGPDPRLEGRRDFVLRALDALDLDTFTVLGHSIGGPLAMAVAAAAPERVRGLALLASVGLHPHRMARRVRRSPDVSRLLGLSPVARALLPTLRRGYERIGFPRSTPDEAIVQCTRVFGMLSFEAVRAAARGVRAPSLIAWSEDDPLVEPAIALALDAVLPEGPRIAFADGGHNIQKTRAVELAAALRDFVR